ncbi:MAG TPA: radical SAM protein [Candidatus Hydrogenedentes bacterium]|nr:radical SAM protein [Candidatus Hydrogenedentota bacterium]HPG67804.1 radical SAM protein [Candidatus Hydrogenedentota bacterium]
MGESYTYVFGPVPSRRLGRSLGIDLVPFKHCSFDCVYCQLGATTCKTVDRREFVPLDDVLAEIDRKLASGVRPDYITMSGSGEPTLYLRLGELIAAIKRRTDVPVAVITNGSLLWHPEVRQAIVQADLVVPSLDAADAALFQRINRPDPSLHIEQIVDGLMAFRNEFAGQLWLEVFVLPITEEGDIRRIADAAERIRPDRVQLNTVERPPTDRSATAVPRARMAQFAAIFGNRAEVIADYRGTHDTETFTVTRDEVLDLIRRRPCTLADVAHGLGIHRNEATKHLGHLIEQDKARAEERNGETYFVASGE